VTLRCWVSDSTKLPELIATCAERVLELGCDLIVTTIDEKEASRFETIGGTLGKESILLGRSLKQA
jgi:hypothetical protein